MMTKKQEQIIVISDSMLELQSGMLRKHALKAGRLDSLIRIKTSPRKTEENSNNTNIESEVRMKIKDMQSMMDSMQPHIEKSLQAYQRKAKDIEKVMQEIVVEVRDENNKLKKRMELNSVDTIIQARLNDRGINLDYHYAVLTHTDSTRIELKSDQFDRETLSQSYKVSLFPGNIIDSEEQLAVYFPDKTQTIYRSVGWLMGGSIFFTLVVIIAFIATIIIMLRQKRISEVKTDFINNMRWNGSKTANMLSKPLKRTPMTFAYSM
ncbi:MAG: hypothetical protein K9I94_14620 [Bacteroidales bacterium]|nr:hypothetical protein [Bacteroidales bacterium]